MYQIFNVDRDAGVSIEELSNILKAHWLIQNLLRVPGEGNPFKSISLYGDDLVLVQFKWEGESPDTTVSQQLLAMVS